MPTASWKGLRARMVVAFSAALLLPSIAALLIAWGILARELERGAAQLLQVEATAAGNAVDRFAQDAIDQVVRLTGAPALAGADWSRATSVLSHWAGGADFRELYVVDPNGRVLSAATTTQPGSIRRPTPEELSHVQTT